MNPVFRKVVIVEDDVVTLCLLAKYLTDAGYEVSTFSNATAALESVKLNCPDFVITDWHMKTMTGIDLCRQLRALPLPHYVYTVLLTGSEEENGMVTSLEAGADDYFAKPVNRLELLAVLRAGARIRVMEQRLRFLACHDALTGVLNRRSMFDLLDKEWSRSVRHDTPLSCLMIDADYFKRINDTYGHPSGDVVLQTVANRLVEASRIHDTVFRFGGEEFCVILPETPESGAMLFGERCRSVIAASPVPAHEHLIPITASIGVAIRTKEMSAPIQLIEAADRALLIAKKLGRNCVVCDGAYAPDFLPATSGPADER